MKNRRHGDYRQKLNEGDNQADYQPQTDKGAMKLQERAECSRFAGTLVRSTFDNTKKNASSCYVSKDDSIKKPLLDENL